MKLMKPTCLLLLLITYIMQVHQSFGIEEVMADPRSYTLISDHLGSINGSSATLRCLDLKIGTEEFTCENPARSVLSDGQIPTLTFFDNQSWARDVATLSLVQLATPPVITFNLRELNPNQQRSGVEVILFNCPDWGIGAQGIYLYDATDDDDDFDDYISKAVPKVSCNSFVRACLFAHSTSGSLSITFDPSPGAMWVHIAEVTFLSMGQMKKSSCQGLRATVLPPLSDTPTVATSTPAPGGTTTAASPCSTNASSVQSVVISGAASAVSAALLVAVLSTLIHISLCMCCKKGRAKGSPPPANRSGIDTGNFNAPNLDSHRGMEPRVDDSFRSEDYENGSEMVARGNLRMDSFGVSDSGEGAEYDLLTSGGSYVNPVSREYEEVGESQHLEIKLFSNKAYGLKLPS